MSAPVPVHLAEPALESAAQHRALEIRGIRHEKRADSERLSVRVQGKELWVELEGGQLHSRPEAWLSFALLPALLEQSDIFMEGPAPDRYWERNAHRMQHLFRRWWGGRIASVSCTEHPAWRDRLQFRRKSGARALFFSGGVDSFHALHHWRENGAKPDALIFVEGFDIDPREEARLEMCRKAMREVARAHGVRLLRVRTNLRRMPFFRGVNWEMTHGLAMAGVAHLISGYRHIGIASSYQWNLEVPYGSRWDLDPLFSSRAKQFHHLGGNVSRHEKISAIAADPLVRNHLRVCWQGSAIQGNCGECEKCLRTSLTFEQLGILEQIPSLTHPEPLLARLERITPALDPLLEIWRALRPSMLAPQLVEGMKRLFARSLTRSPVIPSDYAATLSEAQAMAEFCGYRGPLSVA